MKTTLIILSAFLISLNSSIAKEETSPVSVKRSQTSIASIKNYSYYPAFPTDTYKKKIPYSTYKGPRCKQEKIDLLKSKLLKKNPKQDFSKISIPNVAGTITLRHYNAQKSEKTLTWPLIAFKATEYQVLIRFKDKRKAINGHFSINAQKLGLIKRSVADSNFRNNSEDIQNFSLTLNSSKDLDQILAIDLVMSKAFPLLAKKLKSDPIKRLSPELSKLHPQIVATMKQKANGHYDLRTSIPQALKAGKNGYLIITTEEKKKNLTSLKAFARHKRSRGFKVSIITEKHFGGGKGPVAAKNIRNWLVRNYQKEKLLYVLLLGNPVPKDGDVPYKTVGAYYKSEKHILDMGTKAYQKVEPRFQGGELPTDYYYVDLDSDWDYNKNGFLGDHGDYEHNISGLDKHKGIDAQAEVYVGRIPYYGINAKYGNARDVDTILERVIRYENDASNLAWRHNLFYTGDTFERTGQFYHEIFAYNGAILKRNTHSDSLPFVQERRDQKQHKVIDAQNTGQYGMVYYQEHGYPQGIGMMSSPGAKQLSDRYPSTYYLGGCDIASPEYADNVSYALLRHTAVGVYGGTRSVSSQAQNHWLHHRQFYQFLYFGQSNGEALWRKRALEAKGRTIGGTNLLINLLGDPSIVPMPQTYGDALSISPGFDTRLQFTAGSTHRPSITYNIRNNTKSLTKYKIKAHKLLKFSEIHFSLKPYESKNITVSVQNIDKVPLGTQHLKFLIQSTKHSKSQNITLLIEAKKIIFQENFDNPLNFQDSERKTISLPESDCLAKGYLGKAAVIKKHSAKLKLKLWENRNDFTISFSQKLQQSNDASIINMGAVNIYVKEQKLRIDLKPNHWAYIKEGRLSFEGPKIQHGKWQNILVCYDKTKKKLKISVDSKSTEHAVKYTQHSKLPIRELFFHSRKNSKHYIDNLKIFNYPLSIKEQKIVHTKLFNNPEFPHNGSTVKPDKISLIWSNPSRKKTLVQIAEDLHFKRIVYSKKAIDSAEITGLKDKKTYYWRVNHPSKKGLIKSSMVNSFITDSEHQALKFSFAKNIKLPAAKIGVSGYNHNLIHQIRDISWEEKRHLQYQKISGPSWLRIFKSGKLFTNYGPASSDKGNNTFHVRATAEDGTTITTKFTIKVE